MRLRPKIPAQQFTVACMEEQRASLRCRWFGFWMGQLPGEKVTVWQCMWARELIDEAVSK
jgi:hypothetical protein